MDFPLQEIKEFLDHPNFDQKRALNSHKQLLIEKKNRLEGIIELVGQTIQSIEGGIGMSKKDMFEPFDMKKIEEHQKKYEKEVKENYGKTKAYEESKRKTATYKAEDWKRIQEHREEINKRMIQAIDKGPGDEEVQQIISEFRQHITDNFYECTPEIFRGLGDMYVNDPRFTKNFDKYQVGLAQFFREAMHYYCDHLEKN